MYRAKKFKKKRNLVLAASAFYLVSQLSVAQPAWAGSITIPEIDSDGNGEGIGYKVEDVQGSSDTHNQVTVSGDAKVNIVGGAGKLYGLRVGTVWQGGNTGVESSKKNNALTVLGETTINLSGTGWAMGVWSGNWQYVSTTLQKTTVDVTGGGKTFGLLAGSNYKDWSHNGGKLTIEGPTNVTVQGSGNYLHGTNPVPGYMSESTKYTYIMGAGAVDGGELYLRDTAIFNVTADGNSAVGVASHFGGTIETKDLAVTVTALAENYSYDLDSNAQTYYEFSPVPTAIGLEIDPTFGHTEISNSLIYPNFTVDGYANITVTGDKAVGINAIHQGEIKITGDVAISATGRPSSLTEAKGNLLPKLYKNAGGEMVASQAIGIQAIGDIRSDLMYVDTSYMSQVIIEGQAIINNLAGEEQIAVYAARNNPNEENKYTYEKVLEDYSRSYLYYSAGHIEIKGGLIQDNSAFDPTKVHSLYANGGSIYVGSNLDSVTRLRGDVTAVDQGTFRLYLQDERSTLYGNVDNTDGGNSELYVRNGALWTNLFDSNVYRLEHTNAGLIDMTENFYNTAKYQKISVNRYRGTGGIFYMDTDLQKTALADPTTWDKHSDQFFITGTSSTNSEGLIKIKDASLLDGWNYDEEKDRYKALLVTDYSQAAVFEPLESSAGGLYRYTPELIVESEYDSGQDQDVNKWYLVNFYKSGENPRPPDPENPGEPGLPNYPDPLEPLTPEARVPLEAGGAAFASWRWGNTNDTLLKRMGELRYSDNDQEGIWVRYVRAKHSGTESLSFNNRTNMVQVGIDKKHESEKHIWRHGFAVSYEKGKTDFSSGSGKTKNLSLAFYATELRDKGHYLDLVLKGSKLKASYDTYSDFPDHGESSNWAASISAEYGRKKPLNDKQNWFIEPQVQLTYGYLWGDDYTTSRQNIRVSQGNASSLVGRLGVVLSTENVTKKGRPYRFYAKASVLHEFLGKNKFFLQDKLNETLKYSKDYKDTWYEVGVGANVKLSDSSHLYVDLEKSFGGKVKTDYRIEAGFRWQF